MTISAMFDGPRKRKIRKNRQDQFKIVIGSLGEKPLSDGEKRVGKNLVYRQVRYVPSYVYESIPINSVSVHQWDSVGGEYTVYRSTVFDVGTQEQVDQIIEMLNEEYDVVE